MQHLSLRYHPCGGWSAPLPTDWNGEQTLVMVFGAPALADADKALAGLDAAFDRSVRVGCSTAGEIEGSIVHDECLSVAIARFEHSRLASACTDIPDAADSYAAGLRLAQQLPPARDGHALRAVFVLSDGLNVNGTPLVAGLSAGLPAGVSISGGLAGDGSRFGSTWVWAEGRRQTRRVVVVGLYGERVSVGHGCAGGWSDFGPERRITRCEGNVLYELDGKPALDLYKTYLGDRAAALPGAALLFPLAVQRGDGTGPVLVRTILSIDEQARSMTFAGDLPQGGIARLMRANADRLINSAGEAARQAREGSRSAGGGLVISVSCVGRRLVLGERTDEEVESVRDECSGRASHVGFYSYGEISPAASGGGSDRRSELHNQTMTVTVIDEI